MVKRLRISSVGGIFSAGGLFKAVIDLVNFPGDVGDAWKHIASTPGPYAAVLGICLLVWALFWPVPRGHDQIDVVEEGEAVPNIKKFVGKMGAVTLPESRSTLLHLDSGSSGTISDVFIEGASGFDDGLHASGDGSISKIHLKDIKGNKAQ
ncbi:hypothetical protein [Sphingomonas aerolata]|uniref:hypothetical protein n=1 Tax=Sphingomonas aerolata TaxID=185951 RepID=UPI000D3769B2|nr:hypothetical protein [Sphingomonas aerolata]